MKEASPHKESSEDVPWDRSRGESGNRGIEVGFIRGCSGSDGWRLGRKLDKERLGAGPLGLVKVPRITGLSWNTVPFQGAVVEELLGELTVS